MPVGRLQIVSLWSMQGYRSTAGPDLIPLIDDIYLYIISLLS